jgi:hypothetical protein
MRFITYDPLEPERLKETKRQMNKTCFITGATHCDCKGRANQTRQNSVKSTFYSGLWRTAFPRSQQVLALPVSDYMIVEQSEGHGLFGIGVPVRTSRHSQL